jgi:hypothetical protein
LLKVHPLEGEVVMAELQVEEVTDKVSGGGGAPLAEQGASYRCHAGVMGDGGVERDDVTGEEEGLGGWLVLLEVGDEVGGVPEVGRVCG